jgi:hypothetical protein
VIVVGPKGHDRARLVLDTGSVLTTLVPEVAEAVGYTAADRGARSLGYVLGALAFLIAAAVMLRSNVFGRVTAWVGLVFGVASLVPASAGTVGIVFSLVSLVPVWIWLILIARRLLRLGHQEPPMRAPRRQPQLIAPAP